MSWGEMTITLHDASLILGLPIDGSAAIPVVDDRPQMARFADFFHVGDHWMTRPNYDKGGVSHLQLQRLLIPDPLNQVDLLHEPPVVAFGFLLFLLGSTLFPDKSQNRIPITYLDLVEDHQEVRATSWASAALCHLYRSLREASRAEAKLVSFCYTLLQVFTTFI